MVAKIAPSRRLLWDRLPSFSRSTNSNWLPTSTSLRHAMRSFRKPPSLLKAAYHPKRKKRPILNSKSRLRSFSITKSRQCSLLPTSPRASMGSWKRLLDGKLSKILWPSSGRTHSFNLMDSPTMRKMASYMRT
jgi:hypothetical protein